MFKALSVKRYLFIVCGLLVANTLIYRAILAPRPLTISTLEVGKGNATLVRTQSGATILIDTGSDASILRALGTILPPWQRSLDAVILTSDKKASVGGLPDVLSRYRVAKKITLTGDRRLTLGDGTYLDLSLTKNAPAGVSVFDGVSLTKVR